MLHKHFGQHAETIFERSSLLQYLNIKTKSASSGAKSRGSFANHYAVYVLVEDYIRNGFTSDRKGQYQSYQGARFSDIFRRQRELPFGSKLQNHALNSRCNEEFIKYFKASDEGPILRDVDTLRYWINEKLLIISIEINGYKKDINIGDTVIEIINRYIVAKQEAFNNFVDLCESVKMISKTNSTHAVQFIRDQIKPNVDARIFEIVSYTILKEHYSNTTIYWGYTSDDLVQECLVLYKTGKTNANDGGIDFVMRPLGRFFQVTETVSAEKYFLDIDKVNRFPLTFVIKSEDTEELIRNKIRTEAISKYHIDIIVDKFMSSIEEIINVPKLIEIFDDICKLNQMDTVIDEIIIQSRVEFNIEETEPTETDE